MCLDKLENDEEMKKMVEGCRERDSAERERREQREMREMRERGEK